jgi:hypothetical protein
MKQIFIVKSGRLIDFVGWEWLNLKAFDEYSKAEVFFDKVVKQIPESEYQKTEDVEIEELTVE